MGWLHGKVIGDFCLLWASLAWNVTEDASDGRLGEVFAVRGAKLEFCTQRPFDCKVGFGVSDLSNAADQLAMMSSPLPGSLCRQFPTCALKTLWDPLENMLFQTPRRKKFRNMKIGSIYCTTCRIRISMLGHWRSRQLPLLCTIQEREAAEGVRFIVEEDLGSVVYKANAELHSTKTHLYIRNLV